MIPEACYCGFYNAWHGAPVETLTTRCRTGADEDAFTVKGLVLLKNFIKNTKMKNNICIEQFCSKILCSVQKCYKICIDMDPIGNQMKKYKFFNAYISNG